MSAKIAVPNTPRPFDDRAFAVGDLKIESASDQVALYGQLTLAKDQPGLVHARRLQAYLGQIVTTLEALATAGQLPAKVETLAPIRKANPLA